MRLFLSSYKAGNHQEELIELFGEGSEVGVITNAKDYKTPEEREASVNEILDFLADLAMNPVEVDLREYFQQPEATAEALKNYPALWIAGGNTFNLRRALAYSAADKAIHDAVKNDQIAYGGESAGAIIVTPTLTGVEYGDNPNAIPEGYRKGVIPEGLNLISYHLVPHYNSEWTGSAGMIKALKSKRLDYRTLTNDQAVLINGDKEEFLE